MRWLSPPKSKPRQLERAEDNGARLSNQLELMGWAAGLLGCWSSYKHRHNNAECRSWATSNFQQSIDEYFSPPPGPDPLQLQASGARQLPPVCGHLVWHGGAGATACFGNIQFSFKTVLWKLIKVRKTILLHYTSILNSIPDLRLVLEFIVIGLPAVTTNHY